MKKTVFVIVVSILTAYLSRHLLHLPVLTFFASACALIFLSKILGEATEHLAHHMGEQIAGLINVTLSNLAEMIIIGVAVSRGLTDLVQAGIVGSVIGNLLLVMGMSIYFGCRKNGILRYNTSMAWLQLKMLFLVCSALMLPTLFDKHIAPSSHVPFSVVLAIMLFASYLYYYHLSLKDPRFKEVNEQAERKNQLWPKSLALSVITLAGIGAFFMSELLVGEIENVAPILGLSNMFIGFILLPILGNIAEHYVAVGAARKRMADLSLAISVGSASQVGMVVAPFAVLIGFITGHPITLHFADLPLGAIILTFVASFLVLNDDKWEIGEGIMLLALYFALLVAFFFTTV